MSKRNNPESAWLLDAEVKTIIKEKRGRWEVCLKFTNTNNPRQFILHSINEYRTEKLAEIAARHIKQTAEKDTRGYPKTNPNEFNNNQN
ncbi:MAG: hypothetical protein ACPG7X_03325 [Flavobacteriaceae bacterium]